MPAQTTAQNITILHSFAPFERWPTNSDGAEPENGVIFSSNTLYGTTFRGSPSGYGTVFAVNSDGTGFTSLYAFSGGADGRYPYGLVISGNTLYGTTSSGGSSSMGTAGSGSGTVFSINIDGSGFTDLYNFSFAPYHSLNVNTNADGARPTYLIISGGSLYGITGYAGLYGRGTIFSLNTDGVRVQHSS